MASHRPIVFPFKLAAGRPSPIAAVGLRLNGHWHAVEVYVDSGAFYTLFHAKFAVDFGLDYKQGRKVFVQVGDGALIPIYLHKLPLQIGPRRFKATVGFSDKLGVRFHLLGREDVFERFRICFHEKRRLIYFHPLN
ncbi:MAG: hypothetical protein HYY24_24185 [Verrucomicrobia bacterium]|nr:hypothetical protein [Verrucomicrobiota bacterium]